MSPFPGWPGPAFHGGRSKIGHVALPTMPTYPTLSMPQQAGGAGVGLGAPPLPIGLTPGGNGFLGGVPGAAQFGMPPQISGMPSMPSPPNFFTGGSNNGALYQPTHGVQPFDFGNQVQQLRQQDNAAQLAPFAVGLGRQGGYFPAIGYGEP
jgi:hypothetical protein